MGKSSPIRPIARRGKRPEDNRMKAYAIPEGDRSIWGDTHAWAGDVVCPGCKRSFSLYLDFRDREQHVVDETLQLASESLRRNCPEHVSCVAIP
jgi:hypothetical protein